MKVLIRKTLTGTEYWDTEAKRTLFVPAGEKPSFEVTKDPKSMIGGVDLASGEDMKVVDDLPIGNGDTPVVTDLSKLTIPQLKEYAANSGIDIPADVTRKDDIIAYLSDTE
ncbi:hypothetical protein MUB24_06210 [Lederbergia sp. NSJ-179]|uniref:hypothetical protein n=1 Tax=Lederbergia sp. NSJ-179 TaxID=2931402 RepID=UPI001FD4F72F|nr:hypothetical protein [Lederbergia sp. NSJ-179]MCJ7840520.1 hypothetical protein [Lederbergia sp. NSJ-179]